MLNHQSGSSAVLQRFRLAAVLFLERIGFCNRKWLGRVKSICISREWKLLKRFETGLDFAICSREKSQVYRALKMAITNSRLIEIWESPTK